MNLNRLLGNPPTDSLVREADPAPRTQHCPMGGRRAGGTRHEGMAKAGLGRASGSRMAEETAGRQGLSDPETAGTTSLRDLGWNRCAARRGHWGGDEGGTGKNTEQGEAQHREETAATGQRCESICCS